MIYDSIDPSKFKAETLQDSRPFEHSSYPSGSQDPNDIKPPRGDAPEWQKWVYFGLGAGLAGYEVRDQYMKHEDGIKDFLRNQSLFASILSGSKSQGMGVSVGAPQQYVVQGNTTYARTSGGGLAPTSLPTTVNDGKGNTFYRNSSGLLSTVPGQ
jgi:hypothetical protein